MAEEGKERRLPTQWVEVELGAPYAGWKAKGVGNLSPFLVIGTRQRINEYLSSEGDARTIGLEAGMYDAIVGFLREVLIPDGEWNFVDREGKPMPLTGESLRRLPGDLLWALYIASVEAIIKLPPPS